jgi:Protein of unknown function (DUF1822)
LAIPLILRKAKASTQKFSSYGRKKIMETIAQLEIPLGHVAHEYAGSFAVEYEDPVRSRQVYLNTLAVYATHRYLEWFDIPNNLKLSDSWNPDLMGNRNIADLVLPELGRFECRPILPGAESVEIPEEVCEIENLIGYLGVQLDQSLEVATLVGFVRTITGEEAFESEQQPSGSISLNNLESLDNFFSYLDYIKLEFRGVSEDSNRQWQSPTTLQTLLPNGAFRRGVTIPGLEEIQRKYNLPSDAPINSTKVSIAGLELDVRAILSNSTTENNEWSTIITIDRNGLNIPKGLRTKIVSSRTLRLLESLEIENYEKYQDILVTTTKDDTIMIELELQGQIQTISPLRFERPL